MSDRKQDRVVAGRTYTYDGFVELIVRTVRRVEKRNNGTPGASVADILDLWADVTWAEDPKLSDLRMVVYRLINRKRPALATVGRGRFTPTAQYARAGLTDEEGRAREVAEFLAEQGGFATMTEVRRHFDLEARKGSLRPDEYLRGRRKGISPTRTRDWEERETDSESVMFDRSIRKSRLIRRDFRHEGYGMLNLPFERIDLLPLEARAFRVFTAQALRETIPDWRNDQYHNDLIEEDVVRHCANVGTTYRVGRERLGLTLPEIEAAIGPEVMRAFIDISAWSYGYARYREAAETGKPYAGAQSAAFALGHELGWPYPTVALALFEDGVVDLHMAARRAQHEAWASALGMSPVALSRGMLRLPAAALGDDGDPATTDEVED